MNTFLSNMEKATNFGYTLNGDLTHKTTLNPVLDLFALGGAYRTHSDEDCIALFKTAFAVDEALAMKCLFYLRDVLEGQGERRFFRVIIHWLANYRPDAVRRNMKYIPEYGRYDDLYCLVDTPLEKEMFNFLYHEVVEDMKLNKVI